MFAAAGSHGTLGPSLDAKKQTVAHVRAVVKSGGNGMPSYKDRFSASDLDALVQFIVTRSRAR